MPTDLTALRTALFAALAKADGFDPEQMEPDDYEVQIEAVVPIVLAEHADRDARVRAAALTEAADATAAWTGDDTPMEDRPGYDGPVIDPEDRLRTAIDPEVPVDLRDRLIAEHRQMVTDEITTELRRLATTPKEQQ